MHSSRIHFGGTVLLASLLLFLIEPMAAKQLLPAFGGSAAVWMTCLVFFQTALLVGYVYAHWLSRMGRWAIRVHLPLLLLAFLLAVIWAVPARGAVHATTHPFAAILLRLSLSIGLPFIMLSATGPLLQVWLARRQSGGVPYRLYALSNLGSLLALLLYPSLVEPWLPLRMQRLLWSSGFAVFVGLSALIAYGSRRAPVPQDLEADDANTPATVSRVRLMWFLLPMAASMQLSAITAHLSANIAAIPLLWILPLAVYMVTLIVAFQYPGIARHRDIILRLLAVMVASLSYTLRRVEASLPIGVGIAFFLVELLVACLFCHVEVYRLRPRRPSEATLFYLHIAAGGAVGSFLVGIAAPLVFSSNYDLPISFLVTALLALMVVWQQGWAPRLLWSTGSLLLLFVLSLLHAAYHRDTLLTVRNFYGTLRVKQIRSPQQQPMRTLVNGSIQHGTQIFSTELRTTPTTYYAEDSGVGLALRSCCENHQRNIGVVGLGAGTLAAYGRVGDRIRFYEINPAVLPIAHSLFTYERDSAAALSFAVGDARTSLTNEPPQSFDVLAIDAFSGDAIPLHLLTVQAVDLYRREITPCGTLAFHVSNQFVDLQPEVAALAQASGMQARSVSSPGNRERGEFRSNWVLLTNPLPQCARPTVGIIALPMRNGKAVHAWTDDYSSLLPLIRW